MYFHSSYDNGHCHTYNPPDKTATGVTNRLYFMLANIDTDYKDYDIFIHEKDQFWPRSDMFSYGQPEAVELPPDTELDIVFKVAEVSNIHREGTECVEEEPHQVSQEVC